MASDANLVLNLSNLVGMGMAGIDTDTSDTQHYPGSLYFCVDAFGPRILKYGRNRNGSAITRGELQSLVSDDQTAAIATTITNAVAAGSSTTSVETTGLTANDHDGMLCYCLDNDDSAGAAPEGETAIVASNTTTIVTLEANYPFSTAIAVNDDLELIANWQGTDSADGDLAIAVLGVVVGRDGISDGNYGWYQTYGYISADITSTPTTTDLDNLVANANALNDGGSDGIELWCAIGLAVGTDDQVAQTIPVHVTLFQAHGTGTP